MGLGNIGLPGILLIAIVVLVLFGRGKISSLMGEVGKGITSFKKGVAEGNKEVEEAAKGADEEAGNEGASALETAAKKEKPPKSDKKEDRA